MSRAAAVNPGIVDAHVHLWDPARFTYGWLEGSELQRRHDAIDLDATTSSIDQFVVVQADCVASQARAEVAWFDQQADVLPAVCGIVAFAPLEQGAGVATWLRDLQTCTRVVGVRRLLQDEPADFMLTDTFAAGLDALGDAGLPFDVCVRAEQLAAVSKMVTRRPDVQFVLDHLGKPRIGAGDTADEAWRSDLARLARQPNIVCKLSGLSTEIVDGPFSVHRVIGYLRHALDVFGPQRCLFASDWPVLTQRTSHRRWFDTVITALDGYGSDARELVLGGTARRIYRLADLHVPAKE